MDVKQLYNPGPKTGSISCSQLVGDKVHPAEGYGPSGPPIEQPS